MHINHSKASHFAGPATSLAGKRCFRDSRLVFPFCAVPGKVTSLMAVVALLVTCTRRWVGAVTGIVASFHAVVAYNVCVGRGALPGEVANLGTLVAGSSSSSSSPAGLTVTGKMARLATVIACIRCLTYFAVTSKVASLVALVALVLVSCVALVRGPFICAVTWDVTKLATVVTFLPTLTWVGTISGYVSFLAASIAPFCNGINIVSKAFGWESSIVMQILMFRVMQAYLTLLLPTQV